MRFMSKTSWDFRMDFGRGRGQHDALDALAVGIDRRNVNWILDADVSKFFDTVDHDWLMKLVAHRINDPRILRLIQKCLKAGVMDDGEYQETEVGTPQGAVISPLLANVYLHYVFDLWAHQWRGRNAIGKVRALCRRYCGGLSVPKGCGTLSRQRCENGCKVLGWFGSCGAPWQ